MKNLGQINDPKDMVNKEYVDNYVERKFQGENTILADNSFSAGFNNIAGGKAFKIIAEPTGTVGGTGTYKLDSVEGIEVGMWYSAVTVRAAYHRGQIQSVNSANNTVTVNNYAGYALNTAVDDLENYNIYNTFLLDDYPDLGTVDIGYNAIAFGQGVNARNVGAFAEGKQTKALGKYSHTEGLGTIAGHTSHSEGNYTRATGDTAHSEGESTKATGNYTHAEGYETEAEGTYSHTEGYQTKTTGKYAHAEGGQTEANGSYSHSEGQGTKASSQSQHTQGQFNIEDTNNTYAHIVGNGTSNTNRSNAHTLDWSGNAWFAGNVTSKDGKLVTKTEVTTLLDEKVNISDIFEEKSFGWTEFDYTFTTDDPDNEENYYKDSHISANYGHYTIHCAGNTLGFDVWINTIGSYSITINGITYTDETLSIPLTYMETDIEIYCHYASFNFSNMIEKSRTGIDSELSISSKNPVQNKIIANKITEIEDNIKIDVIIDNSTSFGWTEFEISYSSDAGYDFVGGITDSEIKTYGWFGDIIIHCAGQALGFTYNIFGYSNTSITINGETTSYTPAEESGGMMLAESIVIPVTYMESDIVIHDGGMNTWTFTDMQKQVIETVLVGDAVKELNNTVNTLEDKVNDTYTKSEIDIAIANAGHLKREIVTEIPTTGDSHTIYMILSGNSEENNIYLEYMYLNDTWKKIGSSEVDLTDYVKNTDYATSTIAGVVKNGGSGWGVAIRNDGIPFICQATDAEIDSKTSPYKPITPINLEYAVKSVGDGYYVTVETFNSNIEALTQRIATLEAQLAGVETQLAKI